MRQLPRFFAITRGRLFKMNQELVDRSLAYAKALRSYPIEPGMEFDHETLVALSTKMPQNKDIRALFPVVGGLPIDYVCEIQCDNCQSLKKTTLRKTQLISYMECLRRIHNKTHKTNCQTVATCKQCREYKIVLNKQKQENERANFLSTYGKDRESNTDILVKHFLLVDGMPKEGVTWKEIAVEMDRRLSMCNEEKLAQVICEMEYGEFLRTPYWKITSFEVKRKNKFKCVMCDSKERLQVHHKNYQSHGYEHTYFGMQSLTCVCDECHAKHHGHYE